MELETMQIVGPAGTLRINKSDWSQQWIKDGYKPLNPAEVPSLPEPAHADSEGGTSDGGGKSKKGG